MSHIVQISKLAEAMKCVNVWEEIRTQTIHTGDTFIISSQPNGYESIISEEFTQSFLSTLSDLYVVNEEIDHIPWNDAFGHSTLIIH